MEKRVLAAVTLSLLVLLAYQAFVPQPKRPRPHPATPATAASSHHTAGTEANATTTGTGGPASQPSASAAPHPTATEKAAVTKAASTPAASAAALVSEPAERAVTVETNTVTATFSNKGGEITGWRLKQYPDHEGKPVDLVPSAVPAGYARPFELHTEDAGLTFRLNEGFYRVTVNGVPAGDRVKVEGPTTLQFEYLDANGLSARKSFLLQPNGYVLTFTSTVSERGRPLNPVVAWGPGLGDSTFIIGQRSSGSYVQHPEGILNDNGSITRLLPGAIQKAPVHQGTFPFAGIDDHYFIATLVEPPVVRVRYKPVGLPLPTGLQRELVSWDILFAKPPQDVRFFVGPKDFDVLASVDRPLVKSIYYGRLDFLAVPLLRALKWINGYVGNYGWSIIILTILLNAVLFPLRHKSVVSMRKMQQIQPQVKAIQERYSKYKATDPERQHMNKELMALYREKGVNPASGCVPMALTLPVLFAFYSLLSVAIEVRGAPFALWITDLSAHDPYYITPLIMAGTMFWQQKMTPVADPTQAKVMMLTPVIFLSFFLWAPSGLVIYYTVSNLLGIGQQYLTNRLIGDPVVKQVRPPAERRIKSAGAGSTPGARKAQ